MESLVRFQASKIQFGLTCMVVAVFGTICVVNPPRASASLSVVSQTMPAGGHWAPYQRGLVASTSSGPITAGPCTYTQDNDNLHFSSTPPAAVSIHGFWRKRAGTCPKANVTITLEAYYCAVWCGWSEVETGRASSIYPGGGRTRTSI